MGGPSTNHGWALVPGLAFQGVAPGSHLTINDVAAWQRVVSSFVCALTRGAPLVTETLLEACLHHWVQASHAVDLDGR